MNKLTAEEILKKIEEFGVSEHDFAYDDADFYEDEYEVREGGEWITLSPEEMEERYEQLKEELGGWEQVEQQGGEGQGDEWFSVKYFPAHDVYIRTDGWYTSYHGTDFENGYGYEVRPKEKVITVYE